MKNNEKGSFDRFSYEGGVTRYPKDSKIIKQKDGTVIIKPPKKSAKKK